MGRDKKTECARLASVVRCLSAAVAAEEATRQTRHTSQLLLAEAILQRKALYQLVKPLQDEWIQQLPPSDSHDTSILTALSQQLRTTPWATLVPLAAATNPMLLALINADATHVRLLAGLSAQDAAQLTKACVEKLVMLFEMLSPSRYPESLLDNKESAAGSSAGGSHTAAAVEADPVQPDAKQAAKQLLNCLQEFLETYQEAAVSAGVMLLHSPHVTLELCSLNLATGERCSPPASHYLQAARRLRLTTKQVQHLRLLLQQYNRMSRQLHGSGEQLLALSADSFSLQASLSVLQGAPDFTRSATAAGGQHQSSPTGPVNTPAAAPQQEQETATSDLQRSADDSGSVGRPDSGSDSAALEELLQQLLQDRCNVHVVMATWAVSTLTPWQVGEYLVACWPYQPFVASLVDFSPYLTPDDTVKFSVNAAVSGEAAQAAVLADELGYPGAHAFMEARCAVLGQPERVEWALQEAGAVL